MGRSSSPTSAPTPRDWRWWLERTGRVLVGLGVVVALFAAYQLWGTGFSYARSQSTLERDLAQRQAAALSTPATATTAAPGTTTAAPGTTTTATDADQPVMVSGVTDSIAPADGASLSTESTAPAVSDRPPSAAPPPTPAAAPAPAGGGGGDTSLLVARGRALARIEIPSIGVDEIVVAGIGRDDLRKGPGHYPATPMPGEPGNAAIAGHRTTYGAPFGRLNELDPGDEIVIQTFTGQYQYRVTDRLVVAPDDLSVLDPTPDPTLTLTSCHPKYSARQRLVVKARLVEAGPLPAAPTPTTPAPGTTPASASTTTPSPTATIAAAPTVATNSLPAATTVAVSSPAPTIPPAVTLPGDEQSAGALDEGWANDWGALAPTMLWAVVLLAVLAAGWWLGRRTSRLLAYPLAGFVALAVMYVLFENLNRLLPPAM